MAGLSGPSPLGIPPEAAGGGGVFGAEARAQYASMAGLRWRIFRNGLRTRKGALELGATTVGLLIYLLIGAAIATGVGFGSYFLVLNAMPLLPILFWVLMLLWVMVTILLASFQEQFDLGILLRFPIRFSSYYLLFIAFGLGDPATVLGGFFSLGLFAGITAARPSLFLWTAFGLVVFAAFNTLLVRAIFAWIDRWLAQRRSREILGACFMILVLGLQLLNPAVWQHRDAQGRSYNQQEKVVREVGNRIKPWMSTVSSVQRWMPPGLAAASITEADAGHAGAAVIALGVLGVWLLGAGGALATRLRSEYSGENLGQAPARSRAARQSRARPARLPGAEQALRGAERGEGRMPTTEGSIAAVMEKEFRALLRTLPLLYSVGAPLLFMVIFSGVFLRGHGPSGSIFPYALPICVAYAQLGFIQLFYNSLGAEGAGLQLYFLSPTPIRTVMLAKNLFHMILFLLVASAALIVTTVRLGQPPVGILAATIAWILFSLPANMAAGVIFSIQFAFRVNPGRISRQRGSQANALMSLGVQLAVAIVSAAVFALGWWLDRQYLSTAIFLLLGAGAIFLWMRVLSNSARMANGRREDLMATLIKPD